MKFRLLAALCSITVFAGATELRFSLPTDPRSFDPLQVTDQNAESIRRLTAGVLVRLNPASNTAEPVLAESFRAAPDGRTITFHLRAGLRFSDGSPLTAEDVALTIRKALDPATNSPLADTLRSSAGPPQVVVTSPVDVTVRFPSPKPDLDRVFDSLAIAPAHSSPHSLPVVAGPWRIANYRPGESILLERNPSYFRPPAVDSVHISIEAARDVETTKFLRGELDLIDRPSTDNFDRISRSSPASARDLGPSLDSEFLWFNQSDAAGLTSYKREWFRNQAFRRAVSLAIHRDDIVRIVYRGRAHVASGPVSPANRYWFNTGLKPLASDVGAARSALAGAGFRLSGATLTDPAGHPVEFSIVTNADNRSRQQTAAAIQADLAQIGIRVNVVTLEFRSLIERIARTGQYEAALLGFTNVEEDPATQMNVWLSSGGQHTWRPAQTAPATPWEARIDQLAINLTSEVSREKRKAAFDELQRIMVDQSPVLYLVNPDRLVAISNRFRGIHPLAVPPGVLWNLDSITAVP